LLVYTVVLGVYGNGGRVGGRARCGGVHVCDEVVVVALFGPEVCAGVGLALGPDYAAIRPYEECAVEEGSRSAGHGAADGGIAPLVVAGREEVVGYRDEPESGRCEGRTTYEG
jgi:hypothetical protein